MSVLILIGTAPWMPGAAAFAVLFGLGSGISSVVSGTLPLALFGRSGYGRHFGAISSERLIVSFLAAVVFAGVAGAESTPATLWIVGIICVLSATCFGVIWFQCKKMTGPRVHPYRRTPSGLPAPNVVQ